MTDIPQPVISDTTCQRIIALSYAFHAASHAEWTPRIARLELMSKIERELRMAISLHHVIDTKDTP